MGFHEVRFPANLSFGSIGGPERRTDVVTLANGFEERNTPWAHSKRRYDAGVGMRSLDDVELLIAFFEARRGQLYGFRWKDWSDFKSCKPSDEIDYRDQVIAVADGQQTVFGLQKLYISEEAVLPDEATHAVSTSAMPLAMTRAEGRQVAERWLAEARVSRESLRLALPPSGMAVGAGDVVSLPGEGHEALYRVDRVEQGAMQLLEAVRIERAVYAPSEMAEDTPSATAFVAPVPVLPLFLDLPLMTGDEVPHAPHLATTAQPWPGSVAIYDSSSDANYALNRKFSSRSVVGVTQTVMKASPTGLWDRGDVLEVKLISGALESIDQEAMLAGGNLAMIGDGSSGNWELFQFQNAQLVGEDTWWLSQRLRGQLGSDALMPDEWPEGSYVVLFDGAVQQIELTSSNRNVARHYRIGPAMRGYDDPSYVHLTEAFQGNGLRPYRPCHLGGVFDGAGDLALAWVRRTRIDGDSWDLAEVPLGEESESYQIRVTQGGTVLREVGLSAPSWTYDAAARAADGVSGAFDIEVAQVSARYGPGPAARATFVV